MKDQSLKITMLNYEDESTFPKAGAHCIAFDTDGIPHQVFFATLYDKDGKNVKKYWVSSRYDNGELLGKDPKYYIINNPIIAWTEMPTIENKTVGWDYGSYDHLVPNNISINNNDPHDDPYDFFIDIEKGLEVHIVLDKENNMSLASYMSIEKSKKLWFGVDFYGDEKITLNYFNIKDVCMWVKMPKLKKIVYTKYLFE